MVRAKSLTILRRRDAAWHCARCAVCAIWGHGRWRMAGDPASPSHHQGWIPQIGGGRGVPCFTHEVHALHLGINHHGSCVMSDRWSCDAPSPMRMPGHAWAARRARQSRRRQPPAGHRRRTNLQRHSACIVHRPQTGRALHGIPLAPEGPGALAREWVHAVARQAAVACLAS